jgi:predicted metal-dependent phosphoesterase TrpH
LAEFRARRLAANVAEEIMLKGALHVHSTYSDGEFTLPEIRQRFLAHNCRFVCLTDHAEYFDEPKLGAYLERCRALSDEKFVFVAGLEYACQRGMHILGYGSKALTTSTDPQTVIRQINERGAVSVIAHPKSEFFSWIESFESLPRGIEAWNSKYDGRYAPRPATFALVRRLRMRQAGLHAFYGQDLHWKKQFRGLFVCVNCDTPQPKEIIAALTKGEFNGLKYDLNLPSSGILSEELLAQFSRSHTISRSLRRVLQKGKRGLESIGIKTPESLKAQIRRVL